MKRALFITGKLVQDHEFIYPYYRLQEEGFEVIVATEDGKETNGQLGIKIPVNIKIEDVKIEDYDFMVIPGGAKCLEYLRQNKKALQIIYEWDKQGKVIACICHGSQMLISAKIVKGRQISGYYSIKDDIENAGANYLDAPYVTDNNIITCPHYKYLGSWMKESIRVYNQQNDKKH